MLKILYEDRDILVVVKPAGMDSQASRSMAPDMVSEIKKHLHALGVPGDPYVGVVHRLDRQVGGVMVYAKNRQAAAKLSGDNWRNKAEKTYLAAVRRREDACPLENGSYTDFTDWLRREPSANRMLAAREEKPGWTRAELSCREIGRAADASGEEIFLMEIRLHTGLQHQIRAQLALRGYPILGDSKYGGADPKRRENPALFAAKLSFCHPATGKRMTFAEMPEAEIFRRFGEISL